MIVGNYLILTEDDIPRALTGVPHYQEAIQDRYDEISQLLEDRSRTMAASDISEIDGRINILRREIDFLGGVIDDLTLLIISFRPDHPLARPPSTFVSDPVAELSARNYKSG